MRLCISLLVGVMGMGGIGGFVFGQGRTDGMFGQARTYGGVGVLAPATAPAEIGRLVQQLGDDNFTVREAATKRLKEIGKPAISALKAAVAGDDPEVRTRAEALIRRIERPLPPGWESRDKGFLPGGLTVSVRDDTKIIDATDGGMRIHIEQGPGGVEMAVTGMEDGQERTETYKAASAEQLRDDSPEAYSLYEKWSGGPGREFIMRGGVAGNVVVNGGRLVLAPPPRISGDDLGALRLKLDVQMKEAATPAASRRKVRDQIEKMEQTQTADPNMTGPEREKRVKQFLEQCDELRVMLAEMKLPDPGEALPPSSKARLGVSLVERGDIGAPGPTVDRVIEGSRAEKMGLKPGDVIQKVNGDEIHSVADLRKAVAGAKKPLVIEGEREGREVKLEEK